VITERTSCLEYISAKQAGTTTDVLERVTSEVREGKSIRAAAKE